VTSGIRELEWFTVSTDEGVREWVESKIASEDKSGDNIGGGDECVGGGVGVVTSGEVTVVGGDDRVDIALLDVLPIPLADVRAASVSKDQATNILESLDLSVAGDGGTNLLGTEGDGELRLDIQSVVGGLLGDECSARHVLVGRIGAGTDQSNLELMGSTISLNLSSELGERGSQVGRERTVDVGLELGQVNLDRLVVLGTLICLQVVLEGVGVVGDLGPVGRLQVIDHTVIEGEQRGRDTGLSTHIAGGGHSGSGERFETRALVFDDSSSSTLDGENTSELEDNIWVGH
jgi:hypothetical protein